jgi:ribosomal protein S18 acetylase RimI-like enzyme
MTAGDVPAVLDVREVGAIFRLAEVFPQDACPFPRDAIAQRWLGEITTPGIDCLVVLHGSAVVGFAAVRDDEFLHFGIAVEHSGTGIAEHAHDDVINRIRTRGVERAGLGAFTGNNRGRRFYERLGWSQTGERSRSAFPPHAELLHYQCDLTAGSGPGEGRGMHAHACYAGVRLCR